MHTSLIALLLALPLNAMAPMAPTVQRKQATGHPMQYYLSLPKGWRMDRQWPVVVAAEAAEKEFRVNAERFAAARDALPFIIVVPISVTNGSAGLRDPAIYPYTPAVWDIVDRDGICKFDLDGLDNVLRDVGTHYSGTGPVYLTGFESGAHLVWAEVFRHPEKFAAVAPVAGNYRGRCMDDGVISSHPARASLPIYGLHGQLDTLWGPGGGGYAQWQQAVQLARAHGYGQITEAAVPGKAHVPVPGTVLEYFARMHH